MGILGFLCVMCTIWAFLYHPNPTKLLKTPSYDVNSLATSQITFQGSDLANKLSIKPLFINLRILEIYFSFFMLFPDTIWNGKQSMVKCKRDKIDIYYNRGVSRFNISRDFVPRVQI